MLTAMAVSPLNRRAFARALAAGVAAGTLAPAALAAPPMGPQAPAASTTPATATEVDAKVARITALYGSRLSPAQLARVRRTVAGHVAMLERVRGEAMVNSDPPATVLRLAHGAPR